MLLDEKALAEIEARANAAEREEDDGNAMDDWQIEPTEVLALIQAVRERDALLARAVELLKEMHSYVDEGEMHESHEMLSDEWAKKRNKCRVKANAFLAEVDRG